MTTNGCSPSLLSSATASSSSTSSAVTPPSARLTIGSDESLSNASPFPPNNTSNTTTVQSFGLSPASVKSEPVKSTSKRSSKQQQQAASQLLYMDTSSNHSLSPSNCSSPSSTHNPNDSNNNNLSTSNESYSSNHHHHHHTNNQYNSSTASSARFLSSGDTLRIDYPISNIKRSRSNSSRSDSSSTAKQLASSYMVPVTKSEGQSQMMEQDFIQNAECHSAAINLCVTPHSSRDSPACSSSAGSVSHLDNYTGPPHDGEYQMYSEYEPLDFSRPLNLCKNESYRFIPEEGVWRPW